MPAVSYDGRFVTFTSWSTNLATNTPDDLEHVYTHVFVKDLKTGKLTLVSESSRGRPANRGSSTGGFLGTGHRSVVFVSAASNLLADRARNINWKVLVKDLRTRKTRIVSSSSTGKPGNQSSDAPTMSRDGRFIAFESEASNLIVGDNNRHSDVFIKNIQTRATRIVSASETGEPGNFASYSPTISGDGKFIAFASKSSNLISGGHNDQVSIFVKNLEDGKVKLISTSSTGEAGNGLSSSPILNGNGRFLVFTSLASNLVAGDEDGHSDAFVKDLRTGAVSFVKEPEPIVNGGDTQWNVGAKAKISYSGNKIVFASHSAEELYRVHKGLFVIKNPLL